MFVTILSWDGKLLIALVLYLMMWFILECRNVVDVEMFFYFHEL
jgi:hypothetical protein